MMNSKFAIYHWYDDNLVQLYEDERFASEQEALDETARHGGFVRRPDGVFVVIAHLPYTGSMEAVKDARGACLGYYLENPAPRSPAREERYLKCDAQGRVTQPDYITMAAELAAWLDAHVVIDDFVMDRPGTYHYTGMIFRGAHRTSSARKYLRGQGNGDTRYRDLALSEIISTALVELINENEGLASAFRGMPSPGQYQGLGPAADAYKVIEGELPLSALLSRTEADGLSPHLKTVLDPEGRYGGKPAAPFLAA